MWSLFAGAASAVTPVCGEWPAWQGFESRFISRDGRVIDTDSPQRHTVSEGQAYALFFALVADDRDGFERLLRWTENNLANGNLGERLPAWQWGQAGDGRWTVLDPNSAADADLWMTYALAEAGRSWSEPRYRALALSLGRNIQRDEVAELPDLGTVLLPGRDGFQSGERRWRLNPSYTPVMVLRGLQALQPELDWQRLLPASTKILMDAAPAGFAADWVVYEAGRGFLPDEQTQAIGSYNAIRVYLWAGLMAKDDPLRKPLLEKYRPMAQRVQNLGAPPERVNSVDGRDSGKAGPGFSAALLPFLAALGLHDVLQSQKMLLKQKPVAPQAYYEQVLSLFGTGAVDGRYRFTRKGRLHRHPIHSCAASSSSSH